MKKNLTMRFLLLFFLFVSATSAELVKLTDVSYNVLCVVEKSWIIAVKPAYKEDVYYSRARKAEIYISKANHGGAIKAGLANGNLTPVKAGTLIILGKPDGTMAQVAVDLSMGDVLQQLGL